jgi:hypothetical protein
MLPDRLPGNRQYCLDKAVECKRAIPTRPKSFIPRRTLARGRQPPRFHHKVEDILRTLREAAPS